MLDTGLKKKSSFETISSGKDETTDSRSSRSDDSNFFMMKKKITPTTSKTREMEAKSSPLHDDWK